MKLKAIQLGLIFITAWIFLSGCTGPKAGKEPAANGEKSIELSQPVIENKEKNNATMKESLVKEQESKDYKAIKDREQRMPMLVWLGMIIKGLLLLMN